jgi:hypothetical protein
MRARATGFGRNPARAIKSGHRAASRFRGTRTGLPEGAAQIVVSHANTDVRCVPNHPRYSSI